MQIPTFGTAAPKLAENGYQPVPIHWRKKNPCAGKEWQNYVFAESDCSRFRDAGTGLLCGKIIGVDIDVRDARLSQEIERLAEEMLGPAPRRIGQAPKVLRVYQADAPFSKHSTRGYRLPGDAPDDKSHRVEVLAKGQQFVAYNIHEKTGEPYAWNGFGDPLTVPIGLLPSVSEEKTVEFLRRAEELLGEYGMPVGKLIDEDDRAKHEPNEKQQPDDTATFIAALEAIPNDDLEYDDWCRILYAVKGALGDNGLKAFLDWSAKSSKDVPAFSTREFLSARPTRIGAGTIFRLARSRGWRWPQAPRAEPDDWPDPVNILAEFSAPQLRDRDLPEVLAEFPAALSQAAGFCSSFTLSAALATAAAALPDHIQIVGDSKTAWFQKAIIWVLAIGRPGWAKTPSQKEMLGPLWKIHREADEYWQMEVKALEEGVPKPPRPRLILGDVTIEALSEALKDNPGGLIIANDEFEGWLGSMDMYRRGAVSRDRGEWLRLFEGGPHTIERVQRGSVYVPNWGTSILTATTPSVLEKVRKHLPEDGLLQRFLPFVGEAVSNGTPVPELPSYRERYGVIIQRLHQMQPGAHNGCVMLSAEASIFFKEWLKKIRIFAEAFGSLQPALESHFSKYPTFLLRIALVFHACQIAAIDDCSQRDPAATQVSLETLQSADQFLKQASRHAISVYMSRDGNDVYQLARATGIAILTKGVSVVERRKLITDVTAFRRAEPWMQAAALKLLVELGWLRDAPGGYQKPEPTRFAVNPKLAVKFAETAARERERRIVIREAIAEASAIRGSEGED